MKKLLPLALLVSASLAPRAQALGDARSLKGISAVFVLLDGLDNDKGASKIGLTKYTVQTDVARRLRSMGLRVLSREESLNSVGGEILYVNLNVLADAEAACIPSSERALVEKRAGRVSRDVEYGFCRSTPYGDGTPQRDQGYGGSVPERLVRTKSPAINEPLAVERIESIAFDPFQCAAPSHPSSSDMSGRVFLNEGEVFGERRKSLCGPQLANNLGFLIVLSG